MKNGWFRFIFFIFCFSLILGKVNAQKFYEGDFIAGEYVNKVSGGKTYYMTMQFIRDINGNVLYCLEPFVKFNPNNDYQTDSLPSLNNDVIRKVELISYYGYGYGNRMANRWYAITQYLIWKTVSSADIYFTDKLNGNRIEKYINEMNEILNDVNNHDNDSLKKSYKVNYGEDLTLLIDGYKIVESNYSIENKIIKNLTDSGKIKVTKDSGIYNINREFYSSSGSQKLLLKGNVLNNVYDINIEVLKGNILLDIKHDYNLEDYQVCYEVYKEEIIVDKICADKDIIYKTKDLKYGNYVVKQSFISKGYVVDENEYLVVLDSYENKIELINKIIKNKLEIFKYYCYLEDCIEENGAVFQIIQDDRVIDELVTNEDGYGSLELIFGKYTVKQIKGKDGYEFVKDFDLEIDSLLEEYQYTLSNNKIVEEKIEIEENENNSKQDEENEVLLNEGEIVPPNTGINSCGVYILLIFVILDFSLKGRKFVNEG